MSIKGDSSGDTTGIDWMGDWRLRGAQGMLPVYKPNAAIARELLIERHPESRRYSNIASLGNRQQRELTIWIERLEQSRILQYLREGHNSLPELTQRMHWLPALFALAERPRSQAELVAYLAKYLECYMDEQRHAALFVQLRAFTTVGSALLIGGFFLFMRSFSDAQPAIKVDYSGMLQMYVVIGGVLVAILLLRLKAWFWNSESLMRHLALYVYLLNREQQEEA